MCETEIQWPFSQAMNPIQSLPLQNKRKFPRFGYAMEKNISEMDPDNIDISDNVPKTKLLPLG